MSIIRLVQSSTKAPAGETDFSAACLVAPDSILALKSLCKSDGASTLDACRYLLLDLSNRSVVVRMRALSVIDILFFRSGLFRKEVSLNIRVVAQCAGFLGGKVSECTSYRNLLQHRIKELLEIWDTCFGEFLPQIRALARHMKEFLGMKMPDINVRAVQHSAELDMRQQSKEDKTYTRAQQVLQELKLEGGQKLSLTEIKSRLSEINNCFDILFPGVTEAVHTESTAKISYRNGIDIHQKGNGSAPLAKLLWECDGEEVDGGVENGETVIMDAFPGDAADDDDDVAWEDDAENKSDSEDDDSQRQTVSAPYTIEIHLPMTAAGIQNADNAIVVQTIREINNHLRSHALPLLNDWREALSVAIGTYNECQERVVSIGKRIRSNNGSAVSIKDRTVRSGIDHKVMTSISTALAEVSAVDHEVQTLLNTRCRTLLGSATAS